MTITHADLLKLARARFGDNPRDYAFSCPNCGDVAAIRDFIEAGGEDAAASAGQECIGRHLGALTSPAYTGRGCTWTAYGLFPGPWGIEMPDGTVVRSFPLAAKATT